MSNAQPISLFKIIFLWLRISSSVYMPEIMKIGWQ